MPTIPLPQLPESMLYAPRPEVRHTNEKCAIFGVWGDEHPARLTYFGLYALQHRGQESSGIVATDGSTLERVARMGLVANAFRERDLEHLDSFAHGGNSLFGSSGGAIGHNRYSTTGGSDDSNAQPFTGHFKQGPIALAHNGNITNAAELRSELEDLGHAFQATSDTEVILQRIAADAHDHPDDPISKALGRLQGAFSLVLLHSDRLEAARDPWGWRPLVIGKTHEGNYVFASETIALDVIHAEFIREVDPGEIVTASAEGLTSRRFAEPAPRRASCVFEHVYFASPASNVFGSNVQRVREMLGERLAVEAPIEADVTMPMPDSGRSAATGYARASGIAYREGIIPNRYVGRTFIKPTQRERIDAVRLKLNVVSDVVKDHRVIVVDDSIVRGTTTRIKMDQLREAGATEIHLRISCPPIMWPCFFGVDFADREHLIAAHHTVEEIRQELGVDSLHYLSLESLLDVAKSDTYSPEHFCTACFDGDYRIDIPEGLSKERLLKGC